MNTIYVNFKNGEEIEIKDISKIEFIRALNGNGKIGDYPLLYCCDYILNLNEINYIEFLEEEENENI